MRSKARVDTRRYQQLGSGQPHPHIQHANLGTTSIYLQGIDNAGIIATVHARKAPMIPASTGLRI